MSEASFTLAQTTVPAAIATAKAHVQAVDPSAHFIDELKQYPGAKEILQDITGRIPAVMDVMQSLHAAIDPADMQQIAAAVDKRDASALASMKSPVSLQAVQAATSKLKQLTDINGVMAKVQTIAKDPKFLSALQAKYASVGEKADIASVRGALHSVNVDQLGVATQLEALAAGIQKSGHTLPPDAQAILKHVHAELNAIAADVKKHIATVLQLCDSLLGSLK